MFADVDLRKLAEMTAPDRAFLTICLASPRSVREMDRALKRIRRALTGGGPEKDEREYFDENVRLVGEYLDREGFDSGSLCLIACWALDFFLAVPCKPTLKDLVWVDSSPYIRPLAELQEEYENVAVVAADNKRARIFMVTSATAGDEEAVLGNIKNHVRKGGWSQQRYERRRDKQLLLYAREIVDALKRLEQEEDFRRIVLVGGKEILRIIRENLPQAMERKVAGKAVHLADGEAALLDSIKDVFLEQERRSELGLWEVIRAEYLRGGLGVAGLADVLAAAKVGRVSEAIVNRDFTPMGRRCRDCENIEAEPVAECTACGSASVYEVDLVNEIVEMLELTGAKVDFADRIDTLAEAGDIAALLRY